MKINEIPFIEELEELGCVVKSLYSSEAEIRILFALIVEDKEIIRINVYKEHDGDWKYFLYNFIPKPSDDEWLDLADKNNIKVDKLINELVIMKNWARGIHKTLESILKKYNEQENDNEQ